MTVYKDLEECGRKQVWYRLRHYPGVRFQELRKTTKSLARFVGDPSTPRMQVKLNIGVALNDINPSSRTKRTIGKPKNRLQLNVRTSERDSSVVIVTWLRDKQPRKIGSILCRAQEIFYLIEIEAHPFCFPEVGGLGREAYYLRPVANLRVNGKIFPLPHMPA
jgi:hypothetical protein